jgi:glycosyltransferase involved in cell wall biosynthesis
MMSSKNAIQAPLEAVPRREEDGHVGDAPRVIFVVFQTGNLANGGVESLTQIIERLRAVRPVVVTQLDTSANRRWEDAGARVHVLPDASGSGWTGGVATVARMNRSVHQLVREYGARVVHCNDIRALWHAGPGARAAGASVVFNIRDVKPPHQRYGSRWRLAQITDRIVVLSSEMRRQISHRLPGAVPVRRASTPVDHVYSIVDLERMQPADGEERLTLRRRLGIREGELALAYVATVNEKKAQLRFLEEAAPLLRTAIPEARIHFVGDFRPDTSVYARRCSDAVRRLGLEDHVVFEGYSPDCAGWYSACDVTVLASQREGLARCMIESLACGTPVVSFDVCSAREILEQHGCGRVVRQGDYADLVQQLVLLRDQEARAQLGARGRIVAERLFDPGTVVNAYESLYLQLCRTDRNSSGHQHATVS